MRSRLGTLVGLAVIAGALLYLVTGAIGDNLVYFLTPTELKDRGELAYDTPLRLMGQVEPGSVDWQAEALELRFALADERYAIPVLSQGAPPQMFQDGIEVIVEGQLARDGLFRATSLMVKHSNEYAPPEDGDHPSVSPLGAATGGGP